MAHVEGRHASEREEDGDVRREATGHGGAVEAAAEVGHQLVCCHWDEQACPALVLGMSGIVSGTRS